MPLPRPDAANQPWPPHPYDTLGDRISVWSAWHSGDPEQLAAVYAGQTDDAGTGFFASHTGGFASTVRRWVSRVVRYFWGQRSANGQPRRRLHEPLAGDIASASADLLFSEPPTLTAETKPAQALLDQITSGGLTATLLEGAETCAALGGVYLRARWDSDISELPWIDVVAPDCAVPEWSMGHLSAVTFWRVIYRKGRLVVRHLERHEPGVIIHAVYEGTEETLGVRTSLDAYPDTQALAEVVEADGESIPTGTDKLTVAYVPNMRPNRIWRAIPEAAPLGVSDYSGVEGLMDALDLTYTSLIRDVDLGKARLVVPRQYLIDHGAGQGASLDLDRELYEPINVMGGDGGVELKEVQFPIRVDEHEKVILRLKSDIVHNAGYSAQTFGLGGEVAVTATEIAARERHSLTTRDRKTQYWTPALAHILATLLEIAGQRLETVSIEWADAVSIDPESQARTLRELDTARAVSVEEKVRRLHPDWGDMAIAAEVERIKNEQGLRELADPDTFTGLSQDKDTDEEPEGQE